ncbi:autotransporter domain-containing protein [Paralcaligenes sp. KSB-10]|uniref:autotransporter outer membrane beta-barrel domain-containing protein n=1 Tax=Paralcaligenes sp. KSB-10 TaxID=2901142 RepID=UPI001E4BC09C|nr:autotransporter domain-containing protein [Paralcaligenes sp. KSB-10]UHL63216.1 autotransporter domain-containing protein [Paralcaligenes sp. KSB-10]
MTIQRVSVLPLEESGIHVVGAGNGPWQGLPVCRYLWSLVAAVGVSCMGLGDLAVAAPLAETEHKRQHDPLSAVLWSPPPDGWEIIENEAQWGSPDAPFVFSGGALHVGGSFQSNREVRIGERAVINTLADTALHLNGPIGNVWPSREGLAKLGAGTLVLSGANTYAGNTLLLQGTLHVAGNSALGGDYRTLNANTGTVLSYAPGITLLNTLQLQAMDISREVPAGSYADVVPADYADSVQMTVDSGEAIQAGTLAGAAPLVKQGAGRLRISADAMAYFGAATVNQGTLAVDRFFSGSVRVNRGARLQGVGSVGSATIMDGGTLAAGNSLGTLAVQGDLVFKPNARFEVEATPQGAADFVQVGGKALLDGDVIALAEAGDWQTSTHYPILRAEQGLDNSRFASVQSNFAFLTPSLSYDDKQVHLTLTRNDTAFDEVAETPTQEQVADAVEDEAAGGDGSAGPALYDKVVVLDEPQARSAFQQLSGSWAASLQSSLIDDSRFVREAVLEHASPFGPGLPFDESRSVRQAARHADSPQAVGHTSRVLPDALPAQSDRPRFWSQAYYSSADRAAQSGTPADQRSIQGLVLGLGAPVNADWAVGGFFGAQQSHVWRGQSMANARIHSTHLGLNLAGRWRGSVLALGAAHSRHGVESRRKVAVAGLHDDLQSRYQAGGTQIFGEVAWPISLPSAGAATSARISPLSAGTDFMDRGDSSDRLQSPSSHSPATKSPSTLAPFVRLAWVRTHIDGFTEQGGAAALDVLPARPSALFTTLGLRLTHEIETAVGAARIRGLLAWRHASGAVRSFSHQSFRDAARHAVFESEGQALARQAWQFELGVQARLARNVSLGVAYAGQFARRLQDHGARLNLVWAF